MLGRAGPYEFIAGGGIKVAVAGATAEITTLIKGRRYLIVHAGGGDAATTQSPGALFRWSASDAASSNGNFDFAVPAGGMLEVVAQGTTLNIIEMDATSAATAAVYICPIAHE